jgi:hypothetical protein
VELEGRVVMVGMAAQVEHQVQVASVVRKVQQLQPAPVGHYTLEVLLGTTLLLE